MALDYNTVVLCVWIDLIMTEVSVIYFVIENPNPVEDEHVKEGTVKGLLLIW